jgi:putative peptidoglycan lipid II flippase
MIGVAIGTALLPILSRQIAAGDVAASADSQNRALEFSLFLTVPATFALLIIAGPATAALFRHGAFSVADAAATVPTIAAFALGLPAYVLIKVLTPGFYARGDTTSPVRIAAVALVANIVLNLGLMQFFAHIGIALGLVLASWLNALLLAIILRRRGFLALDARLRRRAPRILLAGVLMAAVLLGGLYLVGGWIAGDSVHRISALAVLVGLGLCAYAAAVAVTGAMTLAELKRFLRRRPA